MVSKMDVRNYILRYKEEYNLTKDKSKLLYAAILKGFYIALGGQKGIALSNKFDTVVYNSKIVFTYKMKLETLKMQDKAYEYIYSTLAHDGKTPEYFLGDKIPKSNYDIAALLALLVSNDYTDDMLINQNTVFNIALEILRDAER